MEYSWGVQCFLFFCNAFVMDIFWLVVTGTMEFYHFPYIGKNHPNWLSYFSEGLKPPTSIIYEIFCENVGLAIGRILAGWFLCYLCVFSKFVSGRFYIMYRYIYIYTVKLGFYEIFIVFDPVPYAVWWLRTTWCRALPRQRRGSISESFGRLDAACFKVTRTRSILDE